MTRSYSIEQLGCTDNRLGNGMHIAMADHTEGKVWHCYFCGEVVTRHDQYWIADQYTIHEETEL